MKLDVSLTAPLGDARQRARELAATGVDGLFTFEGNSDVFFPLVHAADTDVDIYANVAIAFPRSPMHLAYQAWDLQAASGGRFALGLGTQIKPHIERRYSATWGRPVERMAELIGVLREIWGNWADGTPLDHRGEFYRVDLMTPLFVPAGLGDVRPPPIWVGALGPRMTETMASVADGIVIHPFNTGAFVAARTLPLVEAGLRGAGRTRGSLCLNVGCIVAPCLTDEEHERATRAIRFNLAFYGSTPRISSGARPPRTRRPAATAAERHQVSRLVDARRSDRRRRSRPAGRAGHPGRVRRPPRGGVRDGGRPTLAHSRVRGERRFAGSDGGRVSRAGRLMRRRPEPRIGC